MSSTNSYKQVFKATSIFGGVQVIMILINLIRSKFIAILLGSVGFGIAGLYNSPLLFITSITSLGIGFSAVRDIAQAHESGDTNKLARTVTIFRRWVWFTGFLGLFITILCSKLLSQISFNNEQEIIPFCILSITILISSLSSGQNAILRGTRRIKDTAKSSLYGAVLGLILTIPLYYQWGVKGIVPGLICVSLITLFFSWHYSRKIQISSIDLTWKATWFEGLSMAKLGIMMSLAGLISNGVTYLITAYISHRGGVEAVGLYNAGWSITNQYVSLVFTAMAADYYPRLAGIHDDLPKLSAAVNQQAEIAVLILGPFMLLYLLLLPFVIPIILSSQFLAILPFTRWVVLGMLFKAASWALGFIILAKGESKLFLLSEILANFLLLSGYIGGYYLMDLEGIGIGFVVLYTVYLFMMVSLCKIRYKFRFSLEFIWIFIIQLLLSIFAFAGFFVFSKSVGLICGCFCFVLSLIHSIFEINKRLNVLQIILKYKKNERDR